MEGFEFLVHRFLAAPSGKAEQLRFKGIDTDSFRLDVIGSSDFLVLKGCKSGRVSQVLKSTSQNREFFPSESASGYFPMESGRAERRE